MLLFVVAPPKRRFYISFIRKRSIETVIRWADVTTKIVTKDHNLQQRVQADGEFILPQIDGLYRCSIVFRGREQDMIVYYLF